MNLNDAERAAAGRLAAVLGTILVMDVTAAPVAPAAAWEPQAPGAGKCQCCGRRRDLVAHTSLAAVTPDICFRCGSDRAQGLGECTSRPRATVSVAHLEWTVEQ